MSLLSHVFPIDAQLLLDGLHQAHTQGRLDTDRPWTLEDLRAVAVTTEGVDGTTWDNAVRFFSEETGIALASWAADLREQHWAVIAQPAARTLTCLWLGRLFEDRQWRRWGADLIGRFAAGAAANPDLFAAARMGLEASFWTALRAGADERSHPLARDLLTGDLSTDENVLRAHWEHQAALRGPLAPDARARWVRTRMDQDVERLGAFHALLAQRRRAAALPDDETVLNALHRGRWADFRTWVAQGYEFANRNPSDIPLRMAVAGYSPDGTRAHRFVNRFHGDLAHHDRANPTFDPIDEAELLARSRDLLAAGAPNVLSSLATHGGVSQHAGAWIAATVPPPMLRAQAIAARTAGLTETTDVHPWMAYVFGGWDEREIARRRAVADNDPGYCPITNLVPAAPFAALEWARAHIGLGTAPIALDTLINVLPEINRDSKETIPAFQERIARCVERAETLASAHGVRWAPVDPDKMFHYRWRLLKEHTPATVAAFIRMGLDFSLPVTAKERAPLEGHGAFERPELFGSVLTYLLTFKRLSVSPLLEAVLSTTKTTNPAAYGRLTGVQTVGAEGETPMHWAARNRDVAALDVLAAHGFAPTALDAKGNTLLHWVMRKYSPRHEAQFAPVVAWCVAHGINIEAVNDKRLTALGVLAKRGTAESVGTLLDQVVALGGSGALALAHVDASGVSVYQRLTGRSDFGVMPRIDRALLMGVIEDQNAATGTPGAGGAPPIKIRRM